MPAEAATVRLDVAASASALHKDNEPWRISLSVDVHEFVFVSSSTLSLANVSEFCEREQKAEARLRCRLRRRQRR